MLTGDSLHIKTDKLHQKELVKLYNKWTNTIEIMSYNNYNNLQWKKLQKYCETHKEHTKEFFVDMINNDINIVGQFLTIILFMFPGELVINGNYCPPNDMELAWNFTFNK